MAQYCYYYSNTAPTATTIHKINFNGSTYRKVSVSLSNMTKSFLLETWYGYSASAFPYSYTDYTISTNTGTISADFTYYKYSGQARYTNNYNAWDTAFETYDLSIYTYNSGGSKYWGVSQANGKTPVFLLPNFMPFITTTTTYHWKNNSISNPIDGRFSVLCTLSAYAGGSMSVPKEGYGETGWQGVYGANGKTTLDTTFTYSLPNGITNATSYFTDFNVSYKYSGTKVTQKREYSISNNSSYFTRRTF